MSDLGYYGLKEYSYKLLMPIKKTKNVPHCKEAISINKTISKYRIRIEHINRQLKCFKIWWCIKKYAKKKQVEF